MNKYSFIVLFIYIFSNIFSQSEFAPYGAEWYYSVPEGMHPPDVGYLKISVAGDTILNGKNAKILTKTHFCADGDNIDWGNEYIYQSGDTIFYWKSDGYYILYIFSQVLGNSWLIKSEDFFYCGSDSTGIIKVDSVGTIIINNDTLAYFYSTPDDTSKWEYKGMTIEKIGNLEYLLPKPVYCGIVDILGGVAGPLRCYYDNELGLYKAENISCDTIISYPLGIRDFDNIQSESIQIYPNPSHSEIYVILKNNQISIDRLVVYDLFGNIVFSTKVNSDISKVDISNINPGFYFIQIIFSNNSNSIYKLIKSL